MNLHIKPKITKELILKHLNEIEIFEYYLGIKVCSKLKSPLRKDNNASATFFVNNRGSLTFKDFGTGYNGDCFKIVMTLFNIGFVECLNKIYNEMILSRKLYTPKINTDISSFAIKYTDIGIKSRRWNKEDLEYWGVDSDILTKFYISACENVFINGECIYTYNKKDPAYSYYFGNNKYKIYFPNRREYRFLSNTNSDILQGYPFIPDTGDILILTKSYKDVLKFSLYNIPAIAPQSEGVKIKPELIKELKERFKRIVVIYDFDLAGVKGTNYLKREYNLPFFFFTNGRFNTINYESKDFAEYVQNHSLQEIEEVITTITTL